MKRPYGAGAQGCVPLFVVKKVISMKCLKCQKYGLEFDRRYKPSDFLEGKKNSLVWIIGLNPKQPSRDVKDLELVFEKKEDIHPYFRDFEKVSQKLFYLLGKDRGVAHTDLVKCFSDEFPPKNCKGQEAQRAITDNCIGYLEEQIGRWSPRIIICNGSQVCKTITEIIKPQTDYGTSYVGRLIGQEISVVLSGFIRRIDNYAKARLGKEIESYLERYGIV